MARDTYIIISGCLPKQCSSWRPGKLDNGPSKRRVEADAAGALDKPFHGAAGALRLYHGRPSGPSKRRVEADAAGALDKPFRDAAGALRLYHG
jgi:hypothetical protein